MTEEMRPTHRLFSDGTYGPEDRLYWPVHSRYSWTYGDQERFEELWTSEADRLADDLVDRFTYGWPFMIPRVIAASLPDLYGALIEFRTESDSPDDVFLRKHPESMYEHIAGRGSFHILRGRRAWEGPREMSCANCQSAFDTGHLAHWEYKRYGPARYCSLCILKASTGSRGSFTRDTVITNLRTLSEALGIIPPSNFHWTPFPMDAANADRDKWMAALTRTPAQEKIREVLGCKDWFGVLQASGLAGDAWRPEGSKYGLGFCRGVDGHMCRSFLEKSVDDWLARHGIPHECEPRYPRHPELNPRGLKRADWLLADGSFVECLGLAGNPWYDHKTQQKREIARAASVRLILIFPNDMLSLEKRFAEYLVKG